MGFSSWASMAGIRPKSASGGVDTCQPAREPLALGMSRRPIQGLESTDDLRCHLVPLDQNTLTPTGDCLLPSECSKQMSKPDRMGCRERALARPPVTAVSY